MATKAKAGPISAGRLKSFIERIEKLEEERKAISGDIRDVYSEAKGVGYDVKTMRKVVQLRKMDAAERDEQETLLDVYLHALGMAMEPAARAVMAGMSYGAAAEKFGVPKTSLHRVVPKSDDVSESGTGITDRYIQKFTETAAVEQPGERAGTTEQRGGPGSALATLSDAAGRSPGDEGEENDAPEHVRVSEADRRADAEHGAAPRGCQGLQRRAGQGTAGRPGQDVRDSRASIECDVGQRGNHAAAGRDASGLDAGRGVDPSSTPPVSALPDLEIPPFLDQRHKARARATG